MAFVFHNAPQGAAAIGLGGSFLGVGGIVNGLAVEFDTYQGAPGSIPYGVDDIANDHAGIFDPDGGFGTTPISLGNIEDGQWHAIAITWSAATQTLSASFDGKAAGTLTTDIVNDFLGGSSFAYLALTGGTGGLFNTQKVQVVGVDALFEGQPSDGGPIANPDSAATAANNPVTINVLANDTDPTGDPLTIVAVSDPAGGTAVINNNGTPANPADDTIVYTPDTGFSGTDLFTYTVSDGGVARVATVTVTVAPPPAPVAFVMNGHATQDVASGVYTLTAGESQAGTVMSAARIDLRQSFTIGFDAYFGTDEFGADGMAFVLHNAPTGAAMIGVGGSGLGIGGIANGFGVEFDTYYSPFGNIFSGGLDIVGDHTSFLDTDGAFGSTPADLGNIEDGKWHGVVVSWIAATQTLSTTFDGKQVASIATDIVGGYLAGSPFAHFGFGGGTGGLFNTQRVLVTSVTATVEGAGTGGDPIANPDSAATAANVATEIAVLGTDTDPNGDPLAVTAARSTTGVAGVSDLGAVLTITSGGTRVTYTGAAAAALQAIAPGATAIDRFTYIVADGKGGSASATVTVTGVNDPPVITSNGGGAAAAISIAENTTAVTTVAATDPDPGQSRVYAIVGGADAGRFTIGAASGVLAFGTAPDFEAPTDQGANNVYDVIVEVADGAGGTDTQAIAVTVTDVAGIAPPASNAATIDGTPENDVLTGLDGANLIRGFDGDDSLVGGAGNDTLQGGNGADKLAGGAGNDVLAGEAGNDRFNYLFGDGADSIDGGAGIDTLVITGTTGSNTLDVIFNGTALTAFESGTITGVEQVTADLLAGTDTLSYAGTTAAVSVNLGTGSASGFTSIAGIENVTGGSGNDTIVGDGGANTLNGGSGADRITGGAGNDTMNGGNGNDVFVFAADFGQDRITSFDFNPSGGQDLLDISALGVTASTFASRVVLADLGSDIRITIDGSATQIIVLAGAQQTSNITASDFILAP